MGICPIIKGGSIAHNLSDMSEILYKRILCVFFSNSAVKVHDSQAYKNMEMTRERISFTFGDQCQENPVGALEILCCL